MINSPLEPIKLFEYSPKLVPKKDIPYDVGKSLWRNYSDQVIVEFPSPKTNDEWQLTSKGWAGYIPITEDLALSLIPKVNIHNLFHMLEYAYDLKSFWFIEGQMNCSSLEEFYDRLVRRFALRILDRGHKGFYHAYQPREGHLPYVRGQLKIRQTSKKPWDINPECHYEEHTSDIEENQILTWTLHHILHSGMCSEYSLPVVRQAYRNISNFSTLVPFRAQDCVGCVYNHLNQDYLSLHALCRFFLDHSGPCHKVGKKTMLPFLVNMPRLYEKFVAEWIRVNLPFGYSINVHENVTIDKWQRVYFDIDLVLYDENGQTARFVMDTKYKVPNHSSSQDIQQIVAYAVTKKCKEAVLIYPKPLDTPLDVMIGDIRVRSLTFSLSENSDEAGHSFIQSLFY